MINKQYEKYKLIDIPMISKVPLHWKGLKLKFIGTLYSGLTGKSGDDFYNEENPLSKRYINFKNIANNFKINPNLYDLVVINENEEQNKVQKGDLFFLMSSENYEDIGRTSVLIDDLEDTYLNSFCRGFRIKSVNFNPVFLNYLLLSWSYRQILSNEAKGFTRINIQVGKINNLLIYAPNDYKEQFKIAQYLDYQTTMIDELIKKKQRLIELLKEKRQSIINEAVTKGLNPNIKMKDSGIEWLSEIPEHWKLLNFETAALKNRYSITGGPFGSDLKNQEYTEQGVRIIQLQNIGVGFFKDDYKIYTTEEKADQLFSCNIYPGDIIIAKMADPVARACIIPNEDKRYIMASDGIRLEVDTKKYNVKFMEYAINSKYFNFQAELNSTGTTRLRIGLTTLKKLKLITPSLVEQNTIVQYLENFNDNFLETLGKLEKQIENLKEYRQSIISEAVTGKIDVREWIPIAN
jgi:type I restriction enzyme S subunit